MLYIGFINSAILEIDISKEISDINFLILGMKYSQLFKREILNSMTGTWLTV